MAVEYSLLMQKIKTDSAVKSSLADFGFAVSEIPWPDDEVQEVAVREWPGQNGEDAYIPPGGLKLKAYDVEVEFVYKGATNTAYTKYKSLRNYLTGASDDGAELKIYDRYWKKGRTKVYLKKLTDIEPFRTNLDEGVSCKATFRVTDPITEITLNYVGD